MPSIGEMRVAMDIFERFQGRDHVDLEIGAIEEAVTFANVNPGALTEEERKKLAEAGWRWMDGYWTSW